MTNSPGSVASVTGGSEATDLTVYFTLWCPPKHKKMNTYNLPYLSQDLPKKWETLSKFSKLEELFPSIDKENLSLIGSNHRLFYHITGSRLPVITDIFDRHGNAGDDSNTHQKTTAGNDRCGFVLFEN